MTVFKKKGGCIIGYLCLLAFTYLLSRLAVHRIPSADEWILLSPFWVAISDLFLCFWYFLFSKRTSKILTDINRLWGLISSLVLIVVLTVTVIFCITKAEGCYLILIFCLAYSLCCTVFRVFYCIYLVVTKQ